MVMIPFQWEWSQLSSGRGLRPWKPRNWDHEVLGTLWSCHYKWVSRVPGQCRPTLTNWESGALWNNRESRQRKLHCPLLEVTWEKLTSSDVKWESLKKKSLCPIPRKDVSTPWALFCNNWIYKFKEVERLTEDRKTAAAGGVMAEKMSKTERFKLPWSNCRKILVTPAEMCYDKTV